MSSVRAAVVLVSCWILIVPAVTGSDCSCDLINSRCDESGVCRCDPGWEGETCSRCVPTPGCRHGNCQQPWQCSCEPGWGGRFCDKDLSVCSEQRPCLHESTCVLQDDGDYVCLCAQGFHGRHCELKTGPCTQSRSPCRNGGQCDDAGGFAAEFSCRCLAGFTGRRCETDVDDCAMRPCANGATCLDAVNRFSCVCPAGFTGRFCTVNLDDCASRPCQNAGRCLDRARGFLCLCRRGFTGATCQTALGDHEADGGDGGGGLVRFGSAPSSANAGWNRSRHDDDDENAARFKLTVSERGSGAVLSQVQLAVLLVLAAVTLGVVMVTAALVLQGHCRGRVGHAPVTTATAAAAARRNERRAADEPDECRIGFLNAAEPQKKKKKLNREVI